MVMYLVLGCLMDAMAMIILTVPIIFPGSSSRLRSDLVRRHHRDDGRARLDPSARRMNVFVIKSVVKDVTFSTIFRGVIPFVATDLLRLVILIAFPLLATWLPTRMMAH